MPVQEKKQLIIFDLDGTLYKFRGGSYKRSLLQKRVLDNAKKYIADKLRSDIAEAQKILTKIQKQYGEDTSIGLEKELGIDRYDYFNAVWDIPAHGIVKKERGLREALLALKREYNLVLLSDAPQVWINNALNELGLKDVFCDNIFSGEGNSRKGLGNAFSNIVKKLGTSPRSCVAIGDQESTDIIPAAKLGMRTIFVHRTKRSKVADVNIKSIMRLLAALTKSPGNGERK